MQWIFEETVCSAHHLIDIKEECNYENMDSKRDRLAFGLADDAEHLLCRKLCLSAEVPSSGAETTSGDFTYELIDEGMVEITDYSGSATNLTIPETLDGNTVLSIGDYAFNFQDQLTQVTIPDTVMYIGESAFSDCGLTSVTIPDSVIEIGSYAFRFCDNLTEITIPDTVLVIGQGILDSTPFAQDASHYKNNALYAGNHLLSVDKDVISGEYDVAPGTRSDRHVRLF